jgi:hypothetical protein
MTSFGNESDCPSDGGSRQHGVDPERDRAVPTMTRAQLALARAERARASGQAYKLGLEASSASDSSEPASPQGQSPASPTSAGGPAPEPVAANQPLASGDDSMDSNNGNCPAQQTPGRKVFFVWFTVEAEHTFGFEIAAPGDATEEDLTEIFHLIMEVDDQDEFGSTGIIEYVYPRVEEIKEFKPGAQIGYSAKRNQNGYWVLERQDDVVRDGQHEADTPPTSAPNGEEA